VKEIFTLFFTSIQTGSGDYPAYPVGNECSLTVDKVTWHVVVHSGPCSPKFMNARNLTLTHHIIMAWCLAYWLHLYLYMEVLGPY